jgi:shikimate dehydrogenase
VLLLGAGGAARGVLAPLLALAPRELLLANRDVARARELVAAFGTLASQARVWLQAVALGALDALAGEPADLILNATAAGLAEQIPPVPAGLIGTHTVCYDLAYGPKSTGFLAAMRARGAAAAHDGLGMLVEQAAEAFALWHGIRPQTAPVLARLRSELD